jgi:hypothetical protein
MTGRFELILIMTDQCRRVGHSTRRGSASARRTARRTWRDAIRRSFTCSATGWMRSCHSPDLPPAMVCWMDSSPFNQSSQQWYNIHIRAS